ncbi:tRNA pseudouridine(55) synthase TruB [Candidatus Dojkabacteria bacterium HGW-Dojkabacteria-1]|uniref:tRNA pseudouridine synthase B n=1 Tax=Candidatus Dojkabacteria bacterium HGW-Dojkabacteria-1 TaxID=2013761 RepID=A0A2N2F438_9BACT|nr:MAG: tRNA pseudouridine(55) synthase TruB [Candidatus Dojkabacteria bacterium HGW-Dojkabacteria-1]
MYMIDGILLIDKEVGITSYDAIRKLKKVLEKGQKIGHGGTLDPFASGLLLVLLGKATKLMERIHSLEKEYVVKGEFGFSTDTQDITGKVLEKNTLIPTIDDIKKVVKESFLGNISQIPPMYSAKKVNGKKAYELARMGESVELKPKEVFIKEFEILQYEYPKIECRIVCSSGTYVRTLIHDLGISLGTYATAKELRRTCIGEFNISNALSSKDIKDGLEKYVIDIFKVNEILENE